jgi:hypothetical protein
MMIGGGTFIEEKKCNTFTAVKQIGAQDDVGTRFSVELSLPTSTSAAIRAFKESFFGKSIG